jgi:hypothetical protein
MQSNHLTRQEYIQVYWFGFCFDDHENTILEKAFPERFTKYLKDLEQ